MVSFDKNKLTDLLDKLKEFSNIKEIRELRKRLQKDQKRMSRPTGVVVLGTLYIIAGIVWLIFAIVFGVISSGLLGGTFSGGGEIVVGIIAGIATIAAAFEFIIAAALFSGKNWGRIIVIVFAIIDLIAELSSIVVGNFFAFVFIILDLVVLYYMWRPHVMEYFQAKN